MKPIALRSGPLAVDVLPERGLDLGDAHFGDRQLAWISPLGQIPWQGDFARSLIGGLMFTCGLRNVGNQSEGQPQHGWYTSLAARDVAVDGARASARVVDAALELRRELELGPPIRIRDATRNAGSAAEPAPLLYHCNFAWDTAGGDAIEIDSAEVVPRDEDARAADWRELGPPGPERVYEHLGATQATVTLGGVRATVRSNLPRLWQWIHPGYGVLGIEPANCSVLGRAHDRAEGRLPVLQPGEERVTELEIQVEAA